MSEKRYLPWRCADCGEDFFVLYTNGKPPSDTACVDCGSDATVALEEDWPTPIAERSPFVPSDSRFEEWWDRTGKGIDPDTEDVPWHDKRKGLAAAAFAAAIAQSRNYTADKACEPTEVNFFNGRRIWIRFDEDENPFLEIDLVVP